VVGEGGAQDRKEGGSRNWGKPGEKKTQNRNNKRREKKDYRHQGKKQAQFLKRGEQKRTEGTKDQAEIPKKEKLFALRNEQKDHRRETKGKAGSGLNRLKEKGTAKKTCGRGKDLTSKKERKNDPNRELGGGSGGRNNTHKTWGGRPCLKTGQVT